jgi:RHS repeat-associated protein
VSGVPKPSFYAAFLLVLIAAFPASRSIAGAPEDPSTSPVQVNRAIPKIQPPANGLKFSDTPTVEEMFRARVFAEPLVPVGSTPTGEENAELAAALVGYSKRTSPDDFASLTGFLNQHPGSSWTAALLTGLGLEYYNTAHYSLALGAWSNAWALADQATDAKAVALVHRAFGELIRMNSRLGRMDELERLLNSVGTQPRAGQAPQRVVDAREALWDMKHRPEIAFKCGPLALRSIRIALGLPGSSDAEILKSVSTQRGCSLPQVAELSRKIGLNYQMAFRNAGDFVVPSVVHWKVGHYAAMVRKTGDLYELQDPTFGNTTWASQAALEAEASGYFLVAPGPLPPGWRAVNEPEGASVWGKGQTTGNDPQHIALNDLAVGGSCPAQPAGMATAKVHLMDVNLHLSDNPVGYAPPVGPKVRFVLDYNLRDLFQPANFNYGNLGPQWTSDWFAYITDTPTDPVADVNLYVAGGGQRTYTGFDTNTQSYRYQQYDNNLLTRTSTNPISYQLLSGDGSKMIFAQSDGSSGSSRNIFLTQKVDPQGNVLTFSYNTNLCLVAVQDAIGQVTTLAYGLPSTNWGTAPNNSFVAADPYKLSSVTDPFGRTATFSYQPQVVQTVFTYVNGQLMFTNSAYAWGLATDTDVIGITSQFGYQSGVTSARTNGGQVTVTYVNFVNSLTTPYGTTSFNGVDDGNTRTMDISYPDGSRERMQYYQAYVYDTNLTRFQSDSPLSVPTRMATFNNYLLERDSYYWDRNASALALGDYSKARQFHFCHTESGTTTSGCLESMKPPLEGRIWFDYPGQNGGPQIIGSSTLPLHVGRVLDDGSTQLYAYGYNSLGNVTNAVDPVGRTVSFIYGTNGIDLLEVRQTRFGKNELLVKITYNSQHCPLTYAGPSGQTATYTYNPQGQLLTMTDALNHTTTCAYDPSGYLLAVDGLLPGTNDITRMTYDPLGRLKTVTDVSGYTLAFNYDALNRITRVTFPDSTFSEYTYHVLDCVAFQDRAGRPASYAYDSMRQLTRTTDPIGRTTLFDWCQCGNLKGITDPMGRRTSWVMDAEGRRTGKQYSDGSRETYIYENTSSRLKQMTDAEKQTTVYTYNPDNTVSSVSYGNPAASTPAVTLKYDPDYSRIASISDAVGTTLYSYYPVTSPPVLGAGKLESIIGPLPNEITTVAYDNLGRPVQETLDGIVATLSFDAAGRVIDVSNELGSFVYGYDGSSRRLTSASYPNGMALAVSYGGILQDFSLQQVAWSGGATPVSRFDYAWDNARLRIMTWSQQTGQVLPDVDSFGYDDANQLLSAVVTNSGSLVNSYRYTYDAAGNRLSEQVGASVNSATYNALNQISTSAAPSPAHTNEWDAMHRLAAVNTGNQRTEFGYDGMSRLAYIRQLQNGSESSFRRFVWHFGRISEERDKTGATVTKRFYPQGVKLETGTNAGAYYYTTDHLGSIRDLMDASGTLRTRYSYDPWGRRIQLAGDLDTDFGFASMFWSSEASLNLTHFRAYDPGLGRWLSRDPLFSAEAREGPNLYTYVGNEPVSRVDPEGLAFTTVDAYCVRYPVPCAQITAAITWGGAQVNRATDALQRGGAAAQTCLANIPGRFQALLERAPEAMRQFQAYVQDPELAQEGTLLKFGYEGINKFGQQVYPFYYNGPPQFWIDFENYLDSLAADIAAETGLEAAFIREFLKARMNYSAL